MIDPNVTHLKDDINKGRTGDKSPGFDPAAAPLGTDEEAGGFGPTPAEIAQARQEENRYIDTPSTRGSAGAKPTASWFVLIGMAAFVLLVALFALNN